MNLRHFRGTVIRMSLTWVEYDDTASSRLKNRSNVRLKGWEISNWSEGPRKAYTVRIWINQSSMRFDSTFFMDPSHPMAWSGWSDSPRRARRPRYPSLRDRRILPTNLECSIQEIRFRIVMTSSELFWPVPSYSDQLNNVACKLFGLNTSLMDPPKGCFWSGSRQKIHVAI